MDKEIKQEYERLKKLFENAEEGKAELVDELLLRAAFLKVELGRLEAKVKKYGSVERSTKGNVRQSLHYKTYLQSLNVYQSIIRTLNTILGKNEIEADDEFDEFLRQARE